VHGVTASSSSHHDITRWSCCVLTRLLCNVLCCAVHCVVLIQAGYDSDVEEAMQKGSQPKQPKQQKQAALKLSTCKALCRQITTNSLPAPQNNQLCKNQGLLHYLLIYMAWAQPKHPAVKWLGASTGHVGTAMEQNISLFLRQSRCARMCCLMLCLLSDPAWLQLSTC
jgi:hypothetical protein